MAKKNDWFNIPLTGDSGGETGKFLSGLGFGGLLMGTGTALEIFDILGQGKEAKRQAYWQAEQARIRAASLHKQGNYIQRATRETVHDLAVESDFAQGAVRASIAKAGVRPSGSAGNQMNRVRAAYDRQRERVSMAASAQMSSLEDAEKALYAQADEMERRGDRAKKSSFWGAGASLLTGGFALGTEFDWWGKKKKKPGTLI